MSNALRELALSPLAWSVGEVTRLRRAAYRGGLRSIVRLPAPVLSVGSLSMGGSGKTPVAAFLARRLAARGLTVGVVCGGYRGTARRWPQQVPHRRSPSARLSRRHGDEAVMLARWLPKTVVIAGRDKAAAANLALERGADVIVIDDGFQHQRLHRDLNILVHGGEPAPSVFPLGPGREHRSALRYADLIWHHIRDGEPRPGGSRSEHVVSRVVPVRLLDADGQTLGHPRDIGGQRVCLMVGIAAPDGFRRLVERLGAEVVERIEVRDHEPFGRRHLRRAARSRPDLILCTEKDLVRCQHPELVALSCEIELLKGEGCLSAALQALGAGR